MKNKLTSEKLKLICLNLSDEISKGDNFLSNKDVTIFNSSIIEIKNSKNLLLASRGWYGNIRSWSGINFVVLSLFTNKLKKIKQTILDIDPKIIKDNKKKFKNQSKKIITHGESLSEGPEDPRLFYHKNDIYILINQLNDKKKRHMFISKVDLKNLTYGDKIEICKDLSTDFEKNWGPFIHKNKLYMIYDINPLKIFELDDNFNCKQVCNLNDNILKKFSESYPHLDFHIRNSTNLINIGNNQYLGLGHGVLDYKNNTDINKYLIPSIDKSKYSQNDKDYFKRFHKLYTGFFYKLDMNSKEITEISPFFQLPNYESKQELIFFPTSIYLDDKKYVNISYNVGDNRSYFLRLHLDIIDISLYDKFSVDFQLNHNINQNYYLELVRNIRKSLGYPVQKKKYYRFGDVDRLYASKRKRLKNKRKTQRKKK
tara:strand:+ start:1568 stop:2848 length:1281 start_codon:yes stop_codon:yes gene_type:complete